MSKKVPSERVVDQLRPPTRSKASTTMAEYPALLTRWAAIIPEKPAPTTITSASKGPGPSFGWTATAASAATAVPPPSMAAPDTMAPALKKSRRLTDVVFLPFSSIGLSSFHLLGDGCDDRSRPRPLRDLRRVSVFLPRGICWAVGAS